LLAGKSLILRSPDGVLWERAMPPDTDKPNKVRSADIDSEITRLAVGPDAAYVAFIRKFGPGDSLPSPGATPWPKRSTGLPVDPNTPVAVLEVGDEVQIGDLSGRASQITTIARLARVTIQHIITDR